MNQNLLVTTDSFCYLDSLSSPEYANPSLAQVALGSINTTTATMEIVSLPREHNLFQFLQGFEATSIPAVALTVWSILLHKYTGQGQFKLLIEQIETTGAIISGQDIACNFTQTTCFEDLLLGATQLPILSQPSHSSQPNNDCESNTALSYSLIYCAEKIEVQELESLIENHLASQQFSLLIAGNTQAYLVYNRELFDGNFIANLIRHFEVLLQQLEQHEYRHAHLTNLSLTTVADVTKETLSWHPESSALDYGNFPIYRHFEDYAQQCPEAVAVTSGGKRLTYGELNLKANQLAHYLMSLQVKAQDCVGVLMEPGWEILMAILAIHKLNGIYLPIDTEFPIARIESIVEQAQPKIILCISQRWTEVETSFSSPEMKIINLAQLNLEQFEKNNPNCDCPLDSISHIFFTSGTTGTPKGVVSSHQNLVHYIFSASAKYRFGNQDSFLSATRFTFSISLLMLLLPLVRGGRVNIITQSELLEPQLLAQAIEQSTFFHLSPSILKMLLDFLEQSELDHKETIKRFAHIRHASSGGDMIPPMILNRLNHIFTGAEVYAIYGSSEISCMGCTFLVPKDVELKQTLVGKPFNSVQLRVLDAQQRVVPVGVKGEIYFAGAGITIGYLNLEQLTKEKYVVLDGQRFYRTGDFGRLTPEGNLQVLGRSDFQVQIRGLRIELADIESNLNLHPGVINSVVIAKEDHEGEKQLVAYLIAAADYAFNTKELRSFLALVLPTYMIPSQFVALEQFPLTPNGKIDRQALPAPEKVIVKSQIATRTNAEQQLATIWAEVLQLEPTTISIEDNFLALGGHSLKATQVTSRIKDTFGVSISLSNLLEFATIEELALQIKIAQKTNNTNATLEVICPLAHRSQIPLSLAQQRLWFLYQMEPQSSAYNIPLALQLTGVVDISLLEQAIKEIVRRHEALRTNFQLVENTPVQIIQPSVTIPLPIIDLTALSEAEREQEYQRLATEEANRCFNLTEDSLLRTTLVQLSGDTQVLLVTMHHIISDGWSLEVFTQELATFYSALTSGQSEIMPELSLQYGDFAAWQRQWAQTEVFSTQLAYWQQQLAALPTLLELPTDHPRPAIQTFAGRVERFSLNNELTQKLQYLSQSAGATLFMTLLAALATLLSRYSNSKDIVIGSPIANRNRRELEPMIGFFVNTLVLRTDLEGNPSFEQLLSQVRNMTLDAYAHQDVPFDKLVEILQPQRSLSHNPLFQVMFILQNGTATTKQMSDVTLTPLAVEQVTAQFDLTLSMEQTFEGLTGFWQYNSDLFEPETIRRMIGHFEMLLTGITTKPNTPVTALPLLTAAERHQLLEEWNDTERVYAQEQCIHSLIEQQVRLTPDEIAVVFEEQQLTYRDLNNQANQLARHLQQLGVQAETLVGVSLERSMEMLIALLAVLKAGGAYVPLDPHYPPDRLDYIFQDAQISILITSSGVITRELKDLVVIDLKSQQQTISQYSTANLDLAYSLDDLAYVIYTSGSTGKPKGVLVTHRGIGNLAYAQNQTFGIKADSCILQFASFSFDASISEIFMTLVAGAKLCLATSESLLPGQNLFKLLQQQQITHVTLPPSALAMLPREPLSKLEAIIVAGESCPPELALQWSQGRNFFNAYGPTEITVCATIGLYQHQSNLPIGRPIANTQIYILDELLQPVPMGVIGEIYIGSIGIARGYLNRPELTAEKFISIPPQSPLTKGGRGERLYKTGDLGRYLADGNIEYLGRIDHQVKIRGFRIELGEIESSLISHPLVSNCLVIAREDVTGDKRLVAYIVTEEKSPTVKELRQFLELSLPNYMIPSHFVVLERFPLTPNGKIERRALPAPELESLTENFIAPRNELEQKLALIWQEVLNLEKLSVQDNFFELGGHSLLAATLSGKLEQTFKTKLPLAMLFQMPTIEQQASFFEQQTHTNAKSWSSLAPIQPKGTKPPLFLFQGVGIYYPLSSHLGEDQPVYGLSIEMIDDSTHWFDQIEELVALYIKEIKAVQPQGPYYFGGISFGGMIALEAAQQLLAEGEQVALLALFDTWKSKVHTSHPIHKKLLTNLRQFSQLGFKYLSSIHNHKKNKSRKIQPIFQNNLSSDASDNNNRKLRQVTQTYLKARENYVPQVYTGEITLFKSMQTSKMVDLGDFEAHLGWGDLAAGGLNIIDVPGDHLGILQEPHVATLAQELKTCLDKCHN